MLRARRDLRPERVAAARALARESRVEDLRTAVAELRADPDLTPDEDLELGIALAVCLTNAEDLPGARMELERVRPLLPRVSALSAASFHTSVGISADGDGDEAVASIVLALASVESVSEASRELALVLRNCGMRLAMEQLFPLAVETTQRAVAVAAAAGLSPGTWQQAVGYAMLCWAMRLEHLGQDEEARARWLDAEQQLSLALADPEIGVLPGALVRANRALVLARLGDATDARRSLEESRDIPARPVTPLLRRRRLHSECVVLLAEGKQEDARHLLTAYWQEAAAQKLPPFAEDGAFLLARLAATEGRSADALRWYREVHERYGRAQYAVWVSRAAAARLRVDQEALLRRAQQLEYDSLSDPLTEVPNRRAFDANLPRLVGRRPGRRRAAVAGDPRRRPVQAGQRHALGTWSVTRCCGPWPGCCASTPAPPTGAPATAGTSSCSACRPAGGRRPRRWPGSSGPSPTTTGTASTTSWPSRSPPGWRAGPTDTASTLFWAADQSLLAASGPGPPG